MRRSCEDGGCRTDCKSVINETELKNEKVKEKKREDFTGDLIATPF